jgi:PAS domain S-box-containing protein
LGYTKAELLTLHIKQLDPPGFAARVDKRLQKVREKGGAVFESAHRRKDGSIMPVEVNCRLHEYEGRPVYFSVIRDITERKRAEMLLRESEERYRSFSRLTSDYVYSCCRSGDEPFRVKWLAGAVEEITGYTGTEIMALGCWLPFVHPGDRPRFSKALLALVPGESCTDEFRLVRKDGAVRWIHEACSCEQGSSPGELVLFGTSTDITARKVAEAERTALNQHLEELVAERTASLEKSNEELAGFTYAISHELRAPIVRIQGFSSILGELCKEVEETAFMASRIENASRELQSVVDSILMLSRFSIMDISRQTVDLSRMAERKLRLLLAENPERSVELAVLPGVEAFADLELMNTCLDNLLNNAFKYTSQTPEARIEFGLLVTAGKKVYFVRDNGAGFDMSYSEKLYAPFQRLHQHQEFPGSGIGLATVKRIISRHGGEVWAESRVGHGATFYFTLGDNG